MGQLTTYFHRIITKQKLLNYGFPSLLRTPAGMIVMEEAEKSMGFLFNSELKELYSLADGCSFSEEPCGKTGLIPIHRFIPLQEAIAVYKMYKFQLGFDLFEEWETSFTPGEQLFPFLTDDCGNYYWVDLNESPGTYGKIYWTNSYPSSPGYAFSSLSAMFETIAEAYERGIFFLDEAGYLETDYDSFDKLAKSINPATTIWDKQA